MVTLFNFLVSVMQGEHHKKGEQKIKYTIKSWTQTNDQFDILKDIEAVPTICPLQNSQGSIGHVIAVVGEWIFDSTFTHAIPLKKENLDFLCSEDKGRPYEFECVHRAVRCTPNNKASKKQKS